MCHDDDSTSSCTNIIDAEVLRSTTAALVMTLLRYLTDDSVYAHRAPVQLWALTDVDSHLMGNSLDGRTLRWLDKIGGVGAGIDLFCYEYALKSEDQSMDIFEEQWGCLSFIEKFVERIRAESIDYEHDEIPASDKPLVLDIDNTLFYVQDFADEICANTSTARLKKRKHFAFLHHIDADTSEVLDVRDMVIKELHVVGCEIAYLLPGHGHGDGDGNTNAKLG